MKKITVLFSLLIILVSCNKNKVFSDFDNEFKDNRWDFENVRTFDFEIKEELPYAIKLQFGHIYDFQEKEVPVEITLTDPKGVNEVQVVNIIVKDENNKELGNCGGDICDVYQVFKEKEHLKKGFYKIRIKNLSKGIFLPNVLGIGVIVEKTE